MQDIHKTIEILRLTLNSMPENTEIRCHLGSLLLTIEDYESALEHFQIVLSKESNNKEALLGMGICSYHKHNLSDALIFLGKLLEKSDQNNAKANLYMAKAYLQLKDIVNARNYYTNAVHQDPKLADDEIRLQLYEDKEPKKEVHKESHNEEPVRLFADGYHDEDLDEDDIQLDVPKITFNDVGGLNDLKETIRHKIIYPFKNPEVFKAYGKTAGGGILLYGPPGCGKTFMAKATAGECQASFIVIGIDDVLDMWLGESEKKLHNIFDLARRKTPSIIFIDEIDALGGSRQNTTTSSTKMLVNQLLSEMDGVDSANDQLLIVGATNSPWFVDSALRRPGRFDRVIFVPPPDLPARIEILQLLTRDLKVGKFDFKNIANKAAEFSGADIKALIEMASNDAINEALKTGKIRDLTEKDFLNALKNLKPTTKEWFSTAKNYATYANQSGTYDDILEYINKKIK